MKENGYIKVLLTNKTHQTQIVFTDNSILQKFGFALYLNKRKTLSKYVFRIYNRVIK